MKTTGDQFQGRCHEINTKLNQDSQTYFLDRKRGLSNDRPLYIHNVTVNLIKLYRHYQEHFRSYR